MVRPMDRYPSVLLVDDSPTNLGITKRVLSRLGCDVTTAEDGSSALERLTQRRFDVVLLDVQLPDMDGPEVARRAIAQLGETAPPVLALTGSVDYPSFRACKEAGMRLVLRKPLKPALLADLLDRLRAADSVHGTAFHRPRTEPATAPAFGW